MKQELAAAEERLARLQIARETVNEVLAATDSDAEVAREKHEAREPRDGSVIGRQPVPPWRPGLDASVLPTAYQDMLEFLTGAGRPLLAKQIAAGIELDSEKFSEIGGVRSKLKRLVRQGWLTEDVPGAFALPPTSGNAS
ncbi:hypothetical protein [Streptomyces sp. BA2]|uniref:hypothetical protein n=1 Tax=Streptomyces sp. BA2 TaxID=436595 RepID=UPI00132A15B0|nr:hypothetical protein [Streptomyces sp. BA2]MWA07903.1 hypothetical protein [Streptomyces sp. BA2]